MAKTGRQLDRQAVADRCGFTAIGTVDTYRRRGTLPEPDGFMGRTPWWFESTIDRWLAARRKRGFSPATHHPAGVTNAEPSRPERPPST